MRIPLFHLNAFTKQPFTGNPAAVCPLQVWLDDAVLLKVAAENNLSETAFFVPRDDVYDLRWFSPRCEVSLCGHATLASAYVVLNLLKPGLRTVRFETLVGGNLTVSQDGDIFSMDFPAMLGKPCPNPPAALIRGLETADVALLKLGLSDRLHVPYRLPLIPGGAEVREAGLAAGAWGVTVSGAGSGLLAVTAPEKAASVAEAMAAAFREAAGPEGVVAFPLVPDSRGVTLDAS